MKKKKRGGGWSCGAKASGAHFRLRSKEKRGEGESGENGLGCPVAFKRKKGGGRGGGEGGENGKDEHLVAHLFRTGGGKRKKKGKKKKKKEGKKKRKRNFPIPPSTFEKKGGEKRKGKRKMQKIKATL